MRAASVKSDVVTDIHRIAISINWAGIHVRTRDWFRRRIRTTPQSIFGRVKQSGRGVWRTSGGGGGTQQRKYLDADFDREGSYSIGAIVLDPKNPLTVWVGTGENNSQRSVSYGNGLYKSDDGGKTWRNVGLKTSEHIGRIAIDPKDSNIVYVAAQGPLWGAGGDSRPVQDD